MKRIFFFSLLISFFALAACTETKDQIIDYGDKEQMNTEANLSFYKIDQRVYRGELDGRPVVGEYMAYFDGERMVKLLESTGEEGYVITNSFYYNENGALYLVDAVTVDPEEITTENKVYIYENKIAAAFVRSSADGSAIDKVQFAPDATVLEKAADYSKMYLDLADTANKLYKEGKAAGQ